MSNRSATDTAQLKRNLRETLRSKRKGLSRFQQKTASHNLKRQLANSGLLLRSKHIAIYAGSDGELDPFPLAPWLMAQRKQIYFPVIGQRGKMDFYRNDKPLHWRKNRFGINEPNSQLNTKIMPLILSIVLVPLVAFDKHGNRLGMGGGYYDRFFSTDKPKFLKRKPMLIGVAHTFQEVDSLPCESWDIALDAVITDQSIFWRKSKQG